MSSFSSFDTAVSEPMLRQVFNKIPKHIAATSGCNAAELLKAAYADTAVVWRGDFHQAKQVLAAVKKRVRKPAKACAPQNIQTAFHTHRMKQAQQSRIINMLTVEIDIGFTLDLPRAPDIYAALKDVYGEDNTEPFLLPLNKLLGYIGAHEWHKKGVDIPALNGKIHVPFGVFSPLRGEYLDLVMQAPLAAHFQTAFDIGTGSGILAALLARRGISHVVGTDTNPRAIACAQNNIRRLGFERQVKIEAVDLFPQGCADLIVCNPPWLPAKPTSDVETALYDPDSMMLKAFLNGVSRHLTPGGEAWLVISDLAEHLQLRKPDFLAQHFQTASLEVVGILKTKPVHKKAADSDDPLAFARNRETTFLYRLKVAES
ncbi:methyltransferase domain protein [Neisseria weaveri ATCC 51223]|nr:methyltransferase domain protein [Neisseria weaveri ATCC 51223]SAY50251.1 methyltransferase domain protein [Neisseria weaveri]